MLVCPQCQFENPDTNKFCQQCGASLTHKVCPECGTQVAYSAKVCQNCGTFTGTVWLGIISERADAPLHESSNPGKPKIEDALNLPRATGLESEGTPLTPGTAAQKNSTEIQVWWDNDHPETDREENLPQPVSSDKNPTPASELAQKTFLDSQQRYQLLERSTPTPMGEVQVRVLDCQPLQATPLEVLLHQQSTAEGNILNLSASGPSLPPLAKAYLVLESQLYPALPRIHDAWLDSNGQQVVLLEDRSDWPVLLDLWHDDEIPQMQLLQLFHEMASMWVALEAENCCTSLLNMSNLRVDEDQSLGLLRLEQDANNFTPTLEALGQVWQHLFMESGRTLFGPIAMLMSDLKENTIQTIEELRSRLQAIAEEFQGETTQQPTDIPPVEPDRNFSVASSYVRTTPSREYQTNDPGDRGDDNDPTVVLPMQLLSLEDAGRTDVGRQRRHNEDYFGIRTLFTKAETPLGRSVQARGLYILCDGMGGHAGGEVASALAVKTLSQYFQDHWQDGLPDEDSIRQGVLKANQAIYDVNQQDARSGSGRMGTTLVMVLVQETQVAVAHVGDSRLYRLSRRQGIEQVTVDHEVGQREIKRGVEKSIAYSRPDSYQLTQALGPRNEHFVAPDIEFFELNEDTLLLLCSDGLSDNDLIETHWQTHLQPLLSSRASLEQGVSELIDLANQYNGHDNITAVLIRGKVRPDLEQARVANS